MASSDPLEIWTVIKFCQDLGKTLTQTYEMIKETPRKTTIRWALVFKWHKQFSESQESLEENTGWGRKKK